MDTKQSRQRSILSCAITLAVVAPAMAVGVARGQGLEEIIVTAQKRSESVMDVPVSITSFSAEDLTKAGVDGMISLQNVTPGLRVDQTGIFVQPTIRGVGSETTGAGKYTNVAIYVDGIYQPSMIGAAFDFNNITQVQVLKGPQGTLFGRNATGGAILVSTLDPSFETSAKIKGTYGRFDDRKLDLYASTGLTETVAANIAVQSRQSDGDITNIYTGKDDYAAVDNLSVRAKFLYEPSESTRFILSLAREDYDDPRAAAAYTALNSVGQTIPGAVVAFDPRTSAQNLAAVNITETESASLMAEIDFDSFSLTSYTSWRSEESQQAADLDSSSAAVFGATWEPTQDTVTLELTFSSTDDGPLSWVAGLYYFKDQADMLPFRLHIGNNIIPFIYSDVDVEAVAAFGDLTWQAADRLYLTAGLRWNKETQEYKYRTAGGPGGNEETWTDVTPRAVARYELTDDTNVYVSYTEGFKSGAFNTTSTDTAPVEPESVEAWEVGLKTQGESWRLDTAAFYYDYTNLQVTSYDFEVGVSRLVNAAAAEIHGAEAQLTSQVSDNFQLGVGVAYTHARYEEFPGVQSFLPNQSGGNTTVIVDGSGNTMSRAPEWTWNIDADYTVPLSYGLLNFYANLYYSTEVFFAPDNQYSQDAFATLDLRTSWRSPDDRLELSVFGTNVTDKDYFRHVTASANQTAAIYARPEVWGISAEYSF